MCSRCCTSVYKKYLLDSLESRRYFLVDTCYCLYVLYLLQAVADVALQEAFAFLGSQSRYCRCDKQGRMALDKAKLEEAGISGEVKLIGAVTHIRITGVDNWNVPSDDNSVGRYFDAIRRAKESSSSALNGLFGAISGAAK